MIKRPLVRPDYDANGLAKYLNGYLLDVERETNALIDANPARTFTINRLADFPPPNSSNQIVLEGTTHYKICADINLGANCLIAQLGTKISGEIAQRDILRSSNGNGVIYCDGGGVFTTFIVEGIIQIINTAGHGIQYLNNAYLIMTDILLNVPTSKSGILANGSAAFQGRGFTIIGSNIGLDIRGNMAFGAIVDNVNANALGGVGMKFGDNGTTSNVGILTLSGFNFTAPGNAMEINAKASSVTMSQCRMTSTAGHGLVITNTVGNKISNFFATNTNISVTGGNAVDISAGFLDVVTMDKGLLETKTGANFAMKGVAGSTNISTQMSITGLTLRNTVTAANVLSGITIKDTRVRFAGNSGTSDTRQAGAASITTLSDTQASVSTTLIKVNPSAGSTAGELSKFTHTTPYKLTYTGIEPYVGEVTFFAVLSQSSGATKKITLSVFKNGTQYGTLNNASIAADSKNSETATFPLAVDITLNTNDYVELYIKIDSGTTTITYDRLNFRCENSL